MQTQNQLLLLAASALVLLILFKGDTMKIKGLRNNNPGNLRGSNSFTWQGEIGRDKDGFVIFDKPENGIRAMYKTLGTYRNNYEGLAGVGGKGFDTVHEIINRWAPQVENDTASYISHVASVLNLNPFQPVPLDRYPDLIKVIIRHENGTQPYSDKVIYDGIAAA